MDRIDLILDAAERRIRQNGFHAVSFRDLAEDVGIKSASVHYHFPQKADLGKALVARYSENILARLGDPRTMPDTATAIRHAIAVYRQALAEDGALCLCLMLGAESRGLPDKVRTEVAAFFEKMTDWLEDVMVKQSNARANATVILAQLQGAMLLAWALEDTSLFDQATEGLAAQGWSS